VPPFKIRHIDWDKNYWHATRRATRDEIRDVLLSPASSFRRNLPGRVASHIAYGRTADGARIGVAFKYVREARTAVPITAWRI